MDFKGAILTLGKHADFHQVVQARINDQLQYGNSKVLFLLQIYQYF